MNSFFRYLFGYGSYAGNRQVVGAPPSPDAKEAAFVRNSNKRLNALHNLYIKYKGTPHAEKLKLVLDKTKTIHDFMLANKRARDLELFHLQHTDHFINTFSVIIKVHQQHAAPTVRAMPALDAGPPKPKQPVSPPPRQVAQSQRQSMPQQPSNRPFEDKVETVLRKIETETIKGFQTAQKVSEMVRRVAGQAPAPLPPPPTLSVNPPTLAVPVISIDTFSKIYYLKEQTSTGKLAGEIGYTSTDEEKEAFVTHVSSRLGIDRSMLSYLGNTILGIPGGQSMYAPVLNWNGCVYALHLQDYRLYPVRMYRRNR